VSGAVPPEEGSRFGYNVTEFELAYPGYVVRSDGNGQLAWKRSDKGRASGSPIRARTLDGLADQIDAAQNP
jgi:hypothetical protein